MQKSTIMLGVLFLLLATCGALFLLGGTLSASLSVASASAGEHPNAYAEIRDALANGTAPQVFSEPLPGAPEACRLDNVTIELSNPGLISAEWISVSVAGAPGDVAVYSISGESDTVPGRGVGAVNVKIVSRADAPGSRVYHVEYYVFGMKRTVSVAQSDAVPAT